jgi:lipoate-protein ligase A
MTKKCQGGKLVKVAVGTTNGTIENVRITGDFFTHPEGVIEELERKLVGLKRIEVGDAVMKELGTGTLVIGFNPEELIAMIEECTK